MSNFSATNPDRTIGTIIKDLTADLSLLIRSEIALLKVELKEAAAKLGSGSALLAGALFLGLIGLAFFFVTITLGMIALGAPPWLSSLIVTIILFATGAILGVMGKKKLQDVNFVPSESIEHIKTDIESIKSGVERVRSR